jgi:D-glycero-alpha-D-manno-heptose-7-phosphate kinase
MTTEHMLKIISRAPTRIDLAGGTLDIWPLFTFLRNPTTVNVAIDLFAEATLEERHSDQPGIRFISADQSSDTKLSWSELAAFNPPPALSLHVKLLRQFANETVLAAAAKRSCEVTIRTLARSPAGAGIGGSSALGIALAGALDTWAKGHAPDLAKGGENLIAQVRDVETTIIQVPAGMQDYYASTFGGLQCLRWNPGATSRRSLGTDLTRELEQRLLLFYSGQSRNSGINNWALFKGCIDSPSEIRPRFQKLADAAYSLTSALEARDWTAAGHAIHDEWTVRRTLAQGITTPVIDSAFAQAERHGATAGKVCGAGGGGCFFVYLPQPADQLNQAKERVKAAVLDIAKGEVQALPFTTVPAGLDIKVV